MKMLRLCAAVVAILAVSGLYGTAKADIVYQQQGWDGEVRTKFYHMPQGSLMIPADIFEALEQPAGNGRFGDPDFLSQFGFLPSDGPSPLNPNTYPIGFAIDPSTNQIGLTCAACHTADIEVNGERIRIDGAPAHLDFDTFYQTLAKTVTKTLLDPPSFQRFAATHGAADEAAQRVLGARLVALDVRLTADAAIRRPVLASGPGRVDALTQIINALAVTDQSAPGNLYPVAAPTSYPPLWLTSDLEFVQWVPVAASPFERNGGQVQGVFGRTDLSSDAGKNAFRSSMLLEELDALERMVRVLEPPIWDEARMGPIDPALRDEGADLFREHCAACHNMAPYERTDPDVNFFGKTFIRIGRTDFREVGTDPAYIQTLLTRRIMTNDTTAPIFEGQPIVPAIGFFGGTVKASVRRAMADAGLTQEEMFELNGWRFTLGDDGLPRPYAPERPPTYLKSSPLAGVWATGPYLHNGSVPTVYELLSPVAERRAVFWTGGRSVDLTRLGFESEEAPGLFRFDTRLLGNGNGGHEYPEAGLSHQERMAIIEYLKSE